MNNGAKQFKSSLPDGAILKMHMYDLDLWIVFSHSV